MCLTDPALRSAMVPVVDSEVQDLTDLLILVIMGCQIQMTHGNGTTAGDVMVVEAVSLTAVGGADLVPKAPHIQYPFAREIPISQASPYGRWYHEMVCGCRSENCTTLA